MAESPLSPSSYHPATAQQAHLLTGEHMSLRRLHVGSRSGITDTQTAFIGQDRKCPLHCTPPPRKWWMYWQGQELTKQMGKLSDLSAGISMVAPLSLGLSEKKVAMGLRNRGLFCKATSVRFFISSEIEVDVPAD